MANEFETEERPDRRGRIPPPLYYIVGLAVGFLLEWWLGGPIFPRSAAPYVWQAPGLFVLVGGVVLVVVALAMILRTGSSVRPDRPTTALVISGPYRWTRNPMYLGLAMVSAGLAVMANAVWPLLMVAVEVVVVRRLVIDREEKYLESEFGSDYRRYRERVPRWI